MLWLSLLRWRSVLWIRFRWLNRRLFIGLVLRFRRRVMDIFRVNSLGNDDVFLVRLLTTHQRYIYNL